MQLVFQSLFLSSLHPVHFSSSWLESLHLCVQSSVVFPTRPPFLFLEPESVIEYPSHSCEVFAFFPQWFQPVFSLQDISRFPLQVAFVFLPSHLFFFPEFEPLSTINFIRVEPLQSFVNYFNQWILVSFVILHHFLFPVDSIQIFRVDLILSLRLKCSPYSFASRQVILPECSRLLRRFVCVRINSRLSPHSNISIVLVHHLSVHQSFSMVLSLQWALTHRSFSRFLPDSSNFPGVIPNSFQVWRKNGFHQSDAFPRSISNHFHCWLNLFAFYSPGVSQQMMVVLIIILNIWRPKKSSSSKSCSFSRSSVVLASCYPRELFHSSDILFLSIRSVSEVDFCLFSPEVIIPVIVPYIILVLHSSVFYQIEFFPFSCI